MTTYVVPADSAARAAEVQPDIEPLDRLPVDQVATPLPAEDVSTPLPAEEVATSLPAEEVAPSVLVEEVAQQPSRNHEDPPAEAPEPALTPPLVVLPPPILVDDAPTTLRPVFDLDPDLVLPTPPLLPTPIFHEVDEAWLQPLPESARRRGVRIGAWVAVAALCVALPWAVPQIPDLFAEAVPEQTRTPVTVEPSIAPPEPQPSVTAKPDNPLLGKRLRSAGTPLEVTVPRLKVNSSVVPISGQSGSLLPPNNPQILGWWQEGSGVGSAAGSAVVTGHTVSTGGGAFDQLGKLVPGDKIKVRTAAGTIDYVVRQVRDVPVDVLARTAKEIFDQTRAGRLVLITCSDFNGTVYLSNSVVYADPVKDAPQRS
ncbi:MAG: class F sortase [Propionibacteriales bacterium]|nr:class F sortase [Propionibacteriales bacterium]